MASVIRGSDNFDSSNIDPKAIGVGQTWQVVTASRALSTTYTNSTGKPIEVIVSANSAVGDGDMLAKVDSVAIARTDLSDINYTAWHNGAACITFIVPNASTYSVFPSGASTIDYWSELR